MKIAFVTIVQEKYIPLCACRGATQGDSMNRVLAISVRGSASVSSPCGDKGMAQYAPNVVTARFASSVSGEGHRRGNSS